MRAARGLAVAAAVALIAGSAPAGAVDLSGKRIEWIIPFKQGGGSDRWARLYAPLLGPNLPGSPAIVVKFVPGGGSTKGANLFQARARPDGLTILGTSGSTQFPYLLGDSRVRYEYRDWRIVLASATGGVAYVSPDLGVASAAELGKLKGRGIKYASQGATSLDLVPLLAFELLGLDVEAVFGFKGRGPGRLAFERGEVGIDYQTSAAYLSRVVPLVKAGKAVPVMSWGALDDNGNIVRDPTFPDLPSFVEVYRMVRGEEPSGPAFSAWKAFFAAGFAAQKMVFLPKGTPTDIVEAYRTAVARTVAAPGFAAKADKILGEYPQVTGKAAERYLDLAINVDPGAREWVRNWLTEKYHVKF